MKTLVPHKKMLVFLLGLCLCIMQGIPVEAQSLDTRFKSPVPYQRGEVTSIVEQADGKVVMGGDIYFLGTRRVNGLVRLTSRGTVDASFRTDFDGWAEEIVPFKDGGYLVSDDNDLVQLDRAGKVVTYPEIYVEKILMLDNYSFLAYGDGWIGKFNSDFSMDESFGEDGWVQIDGYVTDMERQADKIIIAGDFSEVDWTEINDVARLNADGTVDESFYSGEGTENYIGSITVQPDGKILIGNAYISYYDDNYYGGRIVRLNSDGSVDSDFYTNWFGTVGHLIYRAGKITIASQSYESVYRINENGSWDGTFTPFELDPYADEDFDIVGMSNGDFITINAVRSADDHGVNRFTKDGIQNRSFRPAIATEGWISSIVKSGTRLIVAGDFFKLNNVVTKDLGSLLSNGTVDPSFKFTDEIGSVYDLQAFSDGSVLAYSGWYGLIRITKTGGWFEGFSIDTSWPFNGNIGKYVVLPDDKILIKSAYGMSKRNSDGSVDQSFTYQVNNNYDEYWSDFDLQSDGKIIYVGWFNQLNGVYVNRVARLNTDGTLDNTFNLGGGPNNYGQREVAVFDNDEILVKGYDAYWNGVQIGYYAEGIAKLHADGSFDEDFTDVLWDNFIESPYYYSYPRAFAFRNAAIFWGYSWTAGQWRYNFVNPDGTHVDNKLLPSSVVTGWTVDKFYAPDNRTLYLVGGSTYVNGGQYSTPIVRISYPVMTMTSGRQAVNQPAASMKVFPNPSTDYVSFDIDSPVRVHILSMDGAIKIDKVLMNADQKIDVSNLKPGRYVVKVSANGKVRTEHLIKN
jgi:uncharacterized delta-60 repeat protein